jgi:hypothetical protein
MLVSHHLEKSTCDFSTVNFISSITSFLLICDEALLTFHASSVAFILMLPDLSKEYHGEIGFQLNVNDLVGFSDTSSLHLNTNVFHIYT